MTDIKVEAVATELRWVYEAARDACSSLLDRVRRDAGWAAVAVHVLGHTGGLRDAPQLPVGTGSRLFNRPSPREEAILAARRHLANPRGVDPGVADNTEMPRQHAEYQGVPQDVPADAFGDGSTESHPQARRDR